MLAVYPQKLADNIKSVHDIEWLEIGLVFNLLENGTVDFRDSLVSLGVLYMDAKKAGIDPEPVFRTVENLSLGERGDYAKKDLGGGIISEFLRSEHLKYILRTGKYRLSDF